MFRGVPIPVAEVIIQISVIHSAVRYETFGRSRHGLNQLHSQRKVIIEEQLKLGSFRIWDVLRECQECC